MGRGDLLSVEAREFLDANRDAISFPQAAATSVEEASAFIERERSRLAAAGTWECERTETKDVELAGQVRVRLYRPIDSDETYPVLLYFHGGGWVSGSIEQHDRTCHTLAAVGRLVVGSVDYRLAPENTYPAALDDCQEALTWVRRHIGEYFGGDPARVGVCGSSSGAGLAAALALRVRDSSEPPLGGQVLIYPTLDSAMRGDSHSPEVNGEGFFVDHRQMSWYWGQYVGEDESKLADPYVSPAHARSLEGLPDTVIVTAEYDLLRDDGADYHRRLLNAGVRSRLIHYPGQIHGFMGLFDVLSEAVPAVEGLSHFVGAMLRSESMDVWWDEQ